MRLAFAWVVLAACGGSKAAPAADPVKAGPIVPASPCVADRNADAQQQLFQGPDPDDVIEATAIGDLDSDGAIDEVVRVERLSEYSYAVYLMRGTCGHLVGLVSGFQPTLGSERTERLFDITTIDNSACEGARCGCIEGRTVYRWDGTTYAADHQVSTHSEEKPCDDAE